MFDSEEINYNSEKLKFNSVNIEKSIWNKELFSLLFVLSL